MSYNIDSTQILFLDAFMKAGDVRRFLRQEDNIPEDCFLHDMESAAEDADKGELIPLPDFQWRGEWSGHSYEFLKNKVAPKIIGRVQAIFTWEGGDSFSGLAIKDGKVAECEVVQRLKLPKDWE